MFLYHKKDPPRNPSKPNTICNKSFNYENLHASNYKVEPTNLGRKVSKMLKNVRNRPQKERKKTKKDNSEFLKTIKSSLSNKTEYPQTDLP